MNIQIDAPRSERHMRALLRFSGSRARGKRLLAVFLAIVLVFGQTPTQLWATGIEGIADAAFAASAQSCEQDEPASSSVGAGDSASDDVVGEDSDAAATSSGDAAAQPGDVAARPSDKMTDDGLGTASNVAADEMTGAQASQNYGSADADATEGNTPSQEAPKESGATAMDEACVAADEIDTLTASVAIIGVDASGTDEVWAGEATYEVGEGATAADLIDCLLDDAGLTHEVYGAGTSDWYLSTITSSDGRLLGWDESTGKYWQLFVNGEASDFGAGQVVLKEGDRVALYYSAWQASVPGYVTATASIIGQDAAGNSQVWAHEQTYTFLEGATAADLSERVFAEQGITAQYAASDYGWYLSSITSPYDGSTLGWDELTGKYWQLFVNGETSSVGASSITLQPGDSIAWCYSSDGSSLPGDGDLVLDPSAERPNYDASWGTFGGTSSGAVTTAPTPSGEAEPAWQYKYASYGSADTLVVNDDVYLVTTNGVLCKIDGETGELLASVQTGSTARYFCRLAYTDGVIIVPSDDGILAAFTADTLTCVWRTPSLVSDDSYQALSSLTVANGCVYAGFTSGASFSGPATGGVLACVSVADGSVVWTKAAQTSETGAGEGYYWAGAVASGDDIVIGNEAGKVALVDGATGDELASVNIGASCRAGVVVSDTDSNTLFAVANNGTLYRIQREGDALRIVNSVKFAAYSTSTPAIVGGKAYVCGNNESYFGTLSVIDLASMTVDITVTGGQGQAQSSPLVSVQGSDIYVYFTCNVRPGGIYRYHVGDEAAELFYTPDSASQNYGTASVVADAYGNIYVTNDSGTVFKIKADALPEVPENPDDGDTDDDGDNQPPSGEEPGDSSNDSGDTKGDAGGSAGTVAPGFVPVSDMSDDAVDETTAEDAAAELAADATTLGLVAASRAEDGDGDASTNVWAVAGIAAGAVGLAAVAVYLTRRPRVGGSR